MKIKTRLYLSLLSLYWQCFPWGNIGIAHHLISPLITGKLSHSLTFCFKLNLITGLQQYIKIVWVCWPRLGKDSLKKRTKTMLGEKEIKFQI